MCLCMMEVGCSWGVSVHDGSGMLVGCVCARRKWDAHGVCLCVTEVGCSWGVSVRDGSGMLVGCVCA